MATPYAALKFRDFRFLLAGRFASAFGAQMLTLAVAWELWTRTHSAFALGLIGLSVVLPVLSFSLPAGVFVDRHNRRWVVLFAQLAQAAGGFALAALSAWNGPLVGVYAVLAFLGLARAFNDPASAALVALVVPKENFTNAATWNSSAFQTASIAGPAAAGLLIGWWGSVTGIYFAAGLLSLINLGCAALIRARQSKPVPKAASWESLKEGVRFIRANKIILSAITLDLFAVLLGGAVALLPIYATNILKVGAWGLGIMRSASSLGALTMALVIAHRPPFRRAGKTLLASVAGFGLATIVFGFSPWFPLSVAMLFLLGALDNVSVVIRGTLMLTQVPDEMRGRTSSVNTIFISSSNELGDFESGILAGLVGPVAAVVAGGVGTLAVVAAVRKVWPQLLKLESLDKKNTSENLT